MDKSQEPEEQYELGEIPAVFSMESSTDTKDISFNIYSVTDYVKAQLKSLVRENLMRGSVRALMVMKLHK